MSPLNDDWARYKVPDCEPPSTPPPKPADSRSAVVPPNLDALLAENQRLRDRAVCSGCGGDVDEGGTCHYTDCEGGEMIPASDLPGALLALNDERQEERSEWRFDWEALRAEAKGLEAEIEQLREVLERINAEVTQTTGIPQADKLVGIGQIAREALAGDAE